MYHQLQPWLFFRIRDFAACLCSPEPLCRIQYSKADSKAFSEAPLHPRADGARQASTEMGVNVSEMGVNVSKMGPEMAPGRTGWLQAPGSLTP